MLIGGLLKVTVHRPGWARSMLNCKVSGMADLLVSCAKSCRTDLKRARASSRATHWSSQPLLQWTLNRLEIAESKPQRLKPAFQATLSGTAEAVLFPTCPSQNY